MMIDERYLSVFELTSRLFSLLTHSHWYGGRPCNFLMLLMISTVDELIHVALESMCLDFIPCASN